MSESFSWNKVLGDDQPAAPPAVAPTSGPSTGTPSAPPTSRESDLIEPIQPPIKRQMRREDDEILIDPRNGQLIVQPGGLAEGAYKSNEDLAKEIYRQDNAENYVQSAEFEAVNLDREALPIANVHLDDILRMAIERRASDIHLTVGLPPMIRVDGEVTPLNYQVLEATDTRRLIYETLADEQLQKFEATHELDFAYSVRGLSRFRFNVYMQRGSVAGAMRSIPTKIPSFDQLGLPSIIREMSKRSSGLVLVTGPTGSGKSTTIATMIDDINENRNAHILTIEDPIEYLHRHKRCMVNQREMNADTYSFHAALRAVLREDPDIILVGELRDLETIEAALTLAETGHLVFGTLHTRNAPSTIDRIIDVFPSDQQDQIRVLLGNTLEGVVSQQLLPKLGGGRCAAIEIMMGIPAIKNLIREGKTHQMYSIIETNSVVGMQTMDRSLADHFRNGNVSYEECLMRAVDKETFARLAKGMGH